MSKTLTADMLCKSCYINYTFLAKIFLGDFPHCSPDARMIFQVDTDNLFRPQRSLVAMMNYEDAPENNINRRHNLCIVLFENFRY